MSKSIFALRTTLLGVILATAVSAAPAFATNRIVEVHNKTNTTIYNLWATNVADASYRYDLLNGPAYLIRPGQTVRFNLSDGSGYCRFDMRVRFGNNARHSLPDFNACSVQHIDATADGLVIAYHK